MMYYMLMNSQFLNELVRKKNMSPIMRPAL